MSPLPLLTPEADAACKRLEELFGRYDQGGDASQILDDLRNIVPTMTEVRRELQAVVQTQQRLIEIQEQNGRLLQDIRIYLEGKFGPIRRR